MSSTPPGSTPAGWYPDTNQPGTLRYWDGTAWTEHTHAGTPPQATATAPVASSGTPGLDSYVAAGYQISQPGIPGGPGLTRDALGRLCFAGRPICTPWQRLGAYTLDALLMLVTLFVGWLVWACFTAQEGQTPARRLLGQRVLRYSEGTTASFGWMVGMRGLVAGFVISLAWQCIIPGLVLSFMPFWDDKKQTLTDKISSCVVVEVA